MNTFTIQELDREEIEFLPPRVVMTTCNPRCYSPPTCAPAPSKCVPYCPPPQPKCDFYIGLRLHLSLGCKPGNNGVPMI
jgi:hypothetical protein